MPFLFIPLVIISFCFVKTWHFSNNKNNKTRISRLFALGAIFRYMQQDIQGREGWRGVGRQGTKKQNKNEAVKGSVHVYGFLFLLLGGYEFLFSISRPVFLHCQGTGEEGWDE